MFILPACFSNAPMYMSHSGKRGTDNIKMSEKERTKM